FVLEVNTIPGMTGDHSLVPCAALAAGMSYSALLDEIIRFALEEKADGR
ncbi:MAG: D-alanine--D-alanine ligase, partial [Armatimonadetes bacterium]|nr:D-alanine--D-alanine ligase [Armatimonadota bacterium]NIM24712.1 D-alanine--D-alanine ligase [Armatimonadota bacterium]NIM68592.1 D-alanine--D-alanine ligase [Armatimonadota bacterium]NIM77109.1 D-alanine--D-alanine ligase [Armatimonadota bacterium]NIN06786.1 D-alanine--D-alanine ligase [Armatimonadota bacterium]